MGIILNTLNTLPPHCGYVKQKGKDITVQISLKYRQIGNDRTEIEWQHLVGKTAQISGIQLW